MQGNKRVGLGSGREPPDTLRAYYKQLTYGSGLLQWDIACYKLAEYDITLPADTLPYSHMSGIFIMGVYGTPLLVSWTLIAHAMHTLGNSDVFYWEVTFASSKNWAFATL